jgi:hypothetical protein
MAVEKDNASRYAWGGVVVLCLLILLGWFASRQSSSLDQRQVKAELPKPQARRDAPEFEPTNDSTNAEVATQPGNSATTNAADLYRQAFALYAALTNDERKILRDWRTNVDAAVETKLCEKIHPICDLMHQASTMTNCDWGIDPITEESLQTWSYEIGKAGGIARAAIWSAAHCRSNDVTGATDDIVAELPLGQQLSRATTEGCWGDMSLQKEASAYVAQNLGRFQGADDQRLAAAFNDPAYEDAPRNAMEQEADMLNRFAQKLAGMPAAKAEKEYSMWANNQVFACSNLDQAASIATLKQFSSIERNLAAASIYSPANDFASWLKRSNDLQKFDATAADFLANCYAFIGSVQDAAVSRALVVTALAVARDGVGALQTYPDPSSGQPFAYKESPDGFELRSTYQVKDKPLTMQFKLAR